MQSANCPGHWRCQQREVEQAVRLAPVKDHIADCIAKINQHIQVWQRTRYPAPQHGFPDRCALAHDGNADGTAQREL